MPRRERGILGVPKDGKNKMLFSFNVPRGEEWASDSSDSDYIPSHPESPHPSQSKKPKKVRKRKSGSPVGSNSDDHNYKPSKAKSAKSRTNEDSLQKKTRKSGEKSSSVNGVSKVLLEPGGERYKDVWGRKIPPEILVKIFKCVIKMDGGALPFLIRAARTCRLWWQVSRTPVLWDIVDLSYGWIKSTDATLKFLCPDRLMCVREIKLTGWKNLTNAGVEAIAHNCQELETIDLNGCRKVSGEGVKVIVDKCPRLRVLDLSGTTAVAPQSLKYIAENIGPRLRSLSIGSSMLKGFNTSLNSIMDSCPNLESLDASNSSFTTDFFSLNIERFQCSCPRLRVLRFANVRIRASNTTNAAKAASPGFPDLQELSLAIGARTTPTNSPIGIDNDFLHRILKSSTGLKLLDLRGCSVLTSQGIQDLPVTDLQQLFLSQSCLAHYEGIEVIVQKWRHSLVELDLSWNIYPGASLDIAMNKISGNPQESKLRILNLSGTAIALPRVKSILDGCPYLTHLSLQSCRGLPRGMKKDFEGKTLKKLRVEISTFSEDDVDGNL